MLKQLWVVSRIYRQHISLPQPSLIVLILRGWLCRWLRVRLKVLHQKKAKSQRKKDYASCFWERELVQRVKIVLICMDLIHLLSEYVMETTQMDLTLYLGLKILIVPVDEAEDADADEDEAVVVEGGVDEEEGEGVVVVVTVKEGVVVVVALVTANTKKDGKTHIQS